MRLSALELAAGVEADANAIERVAKETSPEASAWAFTQWRLRERAKRKFTQAEQMLFLAEALEQATHEAVSAYHASLFPSGSLVADLTAGIGGDLIALARRGPAVGYETDPERAAFARFNAEVCGVEAEVIEGDCLAGDWGFEHAFADPSRRVEGRRTLKLEEFSPDPRLLAERMAGLKFGAIKLSPMLQDAELLSLSPRVEFVSYGGECREALVLLGGAPQADAQWEAVHLESGQRLPGGPERGGKTNSVDEPERWFFEADPAAIRVHGLEELAQRHDLFPLGRSNGYLTGRQPVDSPWLTGYRMLDFCPTEPRDAARSLSALHAGTPVVKTRGVNVDPYEFGRKMKLKGSRELVLAFFQRRDGKTMGLILEPRD